GKKKDQSLRALSLLLRKPCSLLVGAGDEGSSFSACATSTVGEIRFSSSGTPSHVCWGLGGKFPLEELKQMKW
uniref:Uncharacterized protein n=1 Tax=Triticum urartu TaxID=4572 RepID=A0A8R7U5S9_TRIUA